MWRNSAVLLRDVLLACLVLGTVVMVLLVSSLEHKGGAPPVRAAAIPGVRQLAGSGGGSGGGFGGATLAGGGSVRVGKRRGGGAAAAPGPLAFPRKFEPVFSPSSSPAPVLPKLYDLRNCECTVEGVLYSGRFEGSPGLGRAPATCVCSGDKSKACPADTNIDFFTDAIGQDVCSLRRYTGYGCTAGCFGLGEAVSWYGHSCAIPGGEPDKEGRSLQPCAPLVVSPSHTPSASMTLRPPQPPPAVTWDASRMVDLRGLRCELHPGSGGRERCFSEDSQGRTLCPDFVTSEYLRNPPAGGEHGVGGDIVTQCGPANAKAVYCTAHCQPGNDRVQWWTHDYAYCYSKDGAWACPSMRVEALVHAASFTVRPWSEPSPSAMPCRAAAEAGLAPGVVENLSVGLLTHEPRAFELSMATYEALGLFAVVKEFLIFINGRNPATEAVVAPYAAKHPGLFRILGNETNLGIAAGMIELTNAATYENFLFMERDFWLVEPATCVVEQLRAGVALLDTRKVHVVRYRHQIKAGRPNWAENFFLGHEDDAFVGRQPNLACNIFYWVNNTVQRWPDKFIECGRNPTMVCSDAYYCNWTNNPQMWRLDWWQKEYVDRFPHFYRNDPYYDLGEWGGAGAPRASLTRTHTHLPQALRSPLLTLTPHHARTMPHAQRAT